MRMTRRPAGARPQTGPVWGYLLAMLLALAVTATGCTQDSPVDSAPELATRLDRVDAAIAAGQQGEVRDAVDALMRATSRAETDGRIDQAAADRITTAARRLLRSLSPGEPDVAVDSTSPAVTEESSSTEDSGDGDPEDSSGGDDNGGTPGEGHGNGRGQGSKGHD